MELEVGAVLTGDLSQQIINKVLDIIDRIAAFITSRIDAAIAVSPIPMYMKPYTRLTYTLPCLFLIHLNMPQ
jgi:hypothetical protein